MAAIDFPTAAESREDYDINNPWTDPVNGGEWWFSPTKVRWLPVPAGGGASVSDTAYDATSWNGVTDEAPSKNAVRDKFESLPTVVDAVTNGSTNAVSGNAVFDALTGYLPRAGGTMTGGQLFAPGSYSEFASGATTSFLAGSEAAFENGTIRLSGTSFTTNLNFANPVGSDKTITFPDAEGTLALTSDIPAAPTAASIATALNAGTQDSTAADTDKLAVTHPAGGWMLLSTLWTWIKAKIDAGMTIDGAQTFTGQVQLAAGQAATDAQSAMSRGLGDARYGSAQSLFLTSDSSSPTTAQIKTVQSLSLDAGTYYFEGCAFAATTSTTGGVTGGFVPSNVSVDICRGFVITGSAAADGTQSAANTTSRLGANLWQYLCGAGVNGGASGKWSWGHFSGNVTFSANVIIYGFANTRTTTAATACVAATRYTILAIGTTDFTLIGAASNTVGLVFTASGAGTGSGTVTAPALGSSIAVTSAVAGRSYVIDSVGTTSFTAIGAAANTVNLSFVATAVGTGTGMVSEITNTAFIKAGSYINFTKF